MVISGVGSTLDPSVLDNLQFAAVSDDGSASDSDKEKAASDITTLAKMRVGDDTAVQKEIDRLDLGDNQVEEKFVNNDLRQFYDKGHTTWNQLKSKAVDYGWKQLDDKFDAMTKGDFSGYEDLVALESGSGAQLNTANIKVNQTNAKRLPKMKQWLKNYAPDWNSDNLTIGAAIGLGARSFNNEPTNEIDLMRGFELAAEGKTDAIPPLADAINGGKVKDSKGNPISGTSRIAFQYITKDGALDKLLKDDPVSMFDMNYGQLLDRVSGESKLNLSANMDSLTDHLASLKGYLNPMLVPGSPGNDENTVMQNMTDFLKHFDGSNPNSSISRINEEYKGMYKDLNDLHSKMGTSTSPAMKKFLEDKNKELKEIKDLTGQFLDRSTNYAALASDNIKHIRDAEKKKRSMAILSSILNGIGGVGILGLATSAGAMTIRTASNLTKGIITAEKIPQFAGLAGLGANLFGQSVIQGKNAKAANDALDKLGLDAKFLNESFNGVNSDFTKSINKLANTFASTDYHVFDPVRLKDYFNWAKDHIHDSSMFNAEADDSKYKGVMPYIFWMPGQYKVTSSTNAAHAIQYLMGQIDRHEVPGPEWLDKP